MTEGYDRQYSSTDVSEDDRAGSDLSGVGFTLDGERFACKGWANALEMSELALAWEEAAFDPDSPAGLSLMARFLRTAFGPEEYRRLRRHFVTHHTPISVQLKITAGVNEEIEAEVARQAERPTGSPRSSSAGRGGRGAQKSEPGSGAAAAERQARVVNLGTGDVTIVGDEPLPPPRRAPARRRRAG